ncbi:MAG: hypothetical protein DRJ55_00930 [Thermoprotei archaeon]|nr:MAG: hypothetical protein DRJ55_00930 [Thermoprotei archaeon]
MNWMAVKAVIVRDLKLVFRSKATLFWTFMFPLILLTGYVALFVPSPSGTSSSPVEIKVALVPQNWTKELVQAANETLKYMTTPWNTSGMKIVVNASLAKNLDLALEKLRKGELDAVILLPEDYYSDAGLHVKIYVLSGTPDRVKEEFVSSFLYSFFAEGAMAMSMGRLYAALNMTMRICPQAAPIAEPALTSAWSEPRVELERVTSGREGEIRSRIIGWMTLSVVFMNFMFGGVLGGASSITEEIRRGFIHRLLSTRLRPSEYFVGMSISWIITLTVAITPVLALGFLVYGGTLAISPFSAEILGVIAIILVAEVLAFSLGIIVGLLARSSDAASVIANIIIWATMMGGGFWIPKFMLPDFLKAFADVNPFSVLFYGLTEIAVYGKSVGAYLLPLSAAVAASLGLYAVASTLYLKYLPKLLESAGKG